MIIVRRITRKLYRLFLKPVLHGIKRKLVHSFANIPVPRTYELTLAQIPAPLIHRKSLAMQAPDIKSGTAYINLPIPAISDNCCLKVSNYSISDNLIKFYIHNYEVSQFLVSSDIEIDEVKDKLFIEHPDVLNVDISELQELWNENVVRDFSYFEIIHSPSVIGRIDCKLPELRISDDLFEPIVNALPQGSDFTNKTQQIKSREVRSGTAQGDLIIPKIRKAYYKQKPSPWDALYPTLCPPLSFYFDDQFDLFKPLRSYQQVGIEFLVNHPSTLLADEMGTGKTIQTINAIRILFRQGKIRCALIICPPITVGSAKLSVETGRSEGWDGHFYHWAPELEVTVLRDKHEQRKIDWKNPAHVYISTYDTIRNDLQNEILKSSDLKKFDCVVLDEAQKIKNRNSKIAKEIRKLQPTYRWALTGTPIENSVEDIKAIFEFVKPGLFEKRDYSQAEIKTIIEPYMLRRLKRDVLKDLPEKTYQEEWLELNERQRYNYEQALSSGRTQLLDTVKSKSVIEVRRSILALVAQLKQIWVVPFRKGQGKYADFRR